MTIPRMMRRIGTVAAVGVMAVCGLAGAVSAQAATVTTTESVPLEFSVFIPCASETVTVTGSLEIVNHTTALPDGSFHLVSHINPQGLSGVGDVTGAKYQGSGVTQQVFNANAGQELTFVNIVRFVGQGPGNDFINQLVVHTTVNANGETTTVVDNVRSDCS